jgi:hypothetical protein
MRTRHHFQPILDSMPSRIAPSAVGALIAPVVLAAVVAHLQPAHQTCAPDDTEMPETGPSTPKNPPK